QINYGDTIQKINDIKNPKYEPLYFYCGSMSMHWNKMLRLYNCLSLDELYINVNDSKDSYFDKEDYNSIVAIKELLNEIKICDNIVVYRYMKKRDFLDFLKNKLTDGVYIDYGFVSTTLLPTSAGMIELKRGRRYQIIMKINVPQNTNGTPVVYNTNNSKLKEYEILLDAGLKFKYKRKKIDFSLLKYVYEFDIVN
ncbi:MAG: ADP-ribosyltransferase, partial [Tissierellia bacterium]|nr:ADP-ribosyltransferase [Tissierellia bacterium]